MTSKDLMKVALVLTLAASASSAFAASANITGSTVIGNDTFSPSANVTISTDSGNAAYSALSQHTSGNRVYFGNNSDSKLYYSTKDTGSTTLLVTPVSNMTVPANWSSL